VRWLLLLSVVFVACKNDEKKPNNYVAPTIVTEALEAAITGESYTQWLEATGGEAPLRWTFEGDLPAGLVFNPAGAISGIPDVPADGTVTLVVTDERGNSDSVDVDLSVALALNAIVCGGGLSGELTEVASIDWYEVNWDASDGYEWIQIPLPTDDTKRIDIDMQGGFFEVYLASPGTPAGDQNLSDNYRQNYVFGEGQIRVDLGTGYDLETYKSFGDPITLLVVAAEPGTWSAQSVCTDGPIFSDLRFLPTLLGDPLEVNFNVFENNDTTTIWTDDPIPDWVEWDESNGRLSGNALETGMIEFDVNAEDADGRSRTESTGFGVYDFDNVVCEEPFLWEPEDGYYEGFLYFYYDTRGYRVFRTPIDPQYSAVTAHMIDVETGEVGFTPPGTSTPYYIGGPSDGDWFGSADYAATVSPQSFPTLKHYMDVDTHLHAVAYSYWETSEEGTFWFECDPKPRPDVHALPVLDASGTEGWDFDVVGGTPPYVWSATGLPAGVTLDSSGRLDSDNPGDGEWDVTVNVMDFTGLETDTDFTLFGGDDEACLGYPRLSCGDTVAGTLETIIWEDMSLGSRQYCLGSDTADNELVTVSLYASADASLFTLANNPGTDPIDAYLNNEYIYMNSPQFDSTEVGVLDKEGFPGLQDWTEQVLFLTVGSWEPGDFELTVDCE